MTTTSALLSSGIAPLDDTWGGLARGRAYLGYGRADSGRYLLLMQVAASGTRDGQHTLVVSPREPAALLADAAALDFDLSAASEAGQVRLLRAPNADRWVGQGDAVLRRALDDLVGLVRTHRPDRFLLDDLSPFVPFRTFEAFDDAFAAFLQGLDGLETTTVLGLGEPANSHSERILGLIQARVAGSVHVALDDEDAQACVLTLSAPDGRHTARWTPRPRPDAALEGPFFEETPLSPAAAVPPTPVDVPAPAASVPPASAPATPEPAPPVPEAPLAAPPPAAAPVPEAPAPAAPPATPEPAYAQPRVVQPEIVLPAPPPARDPHPAEPAPASRPPVPASADAPPLSVPAGLAAAPPPAPARGALPDTFLDGLGGWSDPEPTPPFEAPAPAPAPATATILPLDPPASPSDPEEDPFDAATRRRSETVDPLGGATVSSGGQPTQPGDGWSPPSGPAAEPPLQDPLGQDPFAFAEAEDAAPPPTPREAFRARLADAYATGQPFILIVLRLAESPGAQRAFEVITEGVEAALAPQDAQLADPARRRLAVFRPGLGEAGARPIYGALRDALVQAFGDRAQGVLPHVGAVALPNGEPFPDAQALMRYAFDGD